MSEMTLLHLLISDKSCIAREVSRGQLNTKDVCFVKSGSDET